MLKITLDTNALAEAEALRLLGSIEVAVTTVTEREAEGSSARRLDRVSSWVTRTVETGLLGDSRLDSMVLGGDEDDVLFEKVLGVLSGGGFPKRGHCDDLTDGYRRMMRDALMLITHSRDRRDIFVTNDTKAIGAIDSDQRRQLEDLLDTKLMTVDEFKTFCASQQPER